MRVTYSSRDVINDRPPLLNLRPETDRDQRTMSTLLVKRPEIIYAFGRNPESMKFLHMELITDFASACVAAKLRERVDELEQANRTLRERANRYEELHAACRQLLRDIADGKTNVYEHYDDDFESPGEKIDRLVGGIGA